MKLIASVFMMLFLCTGCQYISSFFDDEGDVKPSITKDAAHVLGTHFPAPNVIPILVVV